MKSKLKNFALFVVICFAVVSAIRFYKDYTYFQALLVFLGGFVALGGIARFVFGIILLGRDMPQLAKESNQTTGKFLLQTLKKAFLYLILPALVITTLIFMYAYFFTSAFDK